VRPDAASRARGRPTVASTPGNCTLSGTSSWNSPSGIVYQRLAGPGVLATGRSRRPSVGAELAVALAAATLVGADEAGVGVALPGAQAAPAMTTDAMRPNGRTMSSS